MLSAEGAWFPPSLWRPYLFTSFSWLPYHSPLLKSYQRPNSTKALMVLQPPHLSQLSNTAKKNQRASEKTSCDLPRQRWQRGSWPHLQCLLEPWNGRGSRHSRISFLKLQSIQLSVGEQPWSQKQPPWPKVGKSHGVARRWGQ